jgi:hypothetical protein
VTGNSVRRLPDDLMTYATAGIRVTVAANASVGRTHLVDSLAITEKDKDA